MPSTNLARGKAALWAAAMMVCAAKITCAATPAALANPDFFDVLVLQAQYSHSQLNPGQLADEEPAIRNSDEFGRPGKRREFVESLTRRQADLRDVKDVNVMINIGISEYDLEDHEYDIDINGGTYIPYSHNRREVRLAVVNGADAQVWKVSPEDARKIRQDNGGSRAVRIEMRLHLLDSAAPMADETPSILKANITSYRVFSLTGSKRLGEVSVPGP